MKIRVFIFFLVLITVFLVFLFAGGRQDTQDKANETDMKITSPAFGQNEKIPAKYTCDGENVNPPLTFSEVPDEARSLVLVVDDPDAVGVVGKIWIHWLVWNIDTSTLEIEQNSIPEQAIQGTTTYDKPGYGGPCPPSGTHRYFFKLYALDIKLNLEQSSGIKELTSAMEGHVIEQAQYVGLYNRSE